MDNLPLIFGGLLLAFLVLPYLALRPRKWSADEPPVIPSWLPYLGHIVSMFLGGGSFLRTLSRKYPQYPIFTLPVGPSRIYVVTSPRLAAEVQRRQKTLQFDPLVPDLTQRVLGLDPPHVELMRRNVMRQEGNWGPVPEMHDNNAQTMAIGPSLDALLNTTVRELRVELKVEPPLNPVDFFEWTAHKFVNATARSLYGPENPIAKDPLLESAFWDFDRGIGSLLIGFMPSVTARRPYHGREQLVKAFSDYLLDENRVAQCADVINKRLSVLKRNDFGLDGMARSELSFLFASIVNTTVSAFWLILRIFADPVLLTEIRKEVEAAGTDTLRADMVPLLASTFSESLRVTSDTSSTRLVTADTVIVDKETGINYCLHANSVVQISAAAMHQDPRLWEDVSAFNPRRFLHAKSASGLRPFGGGATLCPGRHLAIGTVLSWAAAVVSTFEISSASGGPLVVPEKEDRRLPVHVCESKQSVWVTISRRKEWPH